MTGWMRALLDFFGTYSMLRLVDGSDSHILRASSRIRLLKILEDGRTLRWRALASQAGHLLALVLLDDLPAFGCGNHLEKPACLYQDAANVQDDIRALVILWCFVEFQRKR